MNVKQAAERLEISLSLGYRLCEEGRQPHRRIGQRGKFVLDEADLKNH
jgi:excisionase family DNA binding protein